MRIVATISGLRTVHCVRAVFQALAGVPGVEHAEVRMGEATLDVTPAFVPSDLVDALSSLGYAVTEIRTERRPLPLA